jgi:hypothetical protein
MNIEQLARCMGIPEKDIPEHIQITRWVGIWKLKNFRAKWLIPTQHERDEMEYPTKEEAEQDARRLDLKARIERMRRNKCEIERLAGVMDEKGRRHGG